MLMEYLARKSNNEEGVSSVCMLKESITYICLRCCCVALR